MFPINIKLQKTKNTPPPPPLPTQNPQHTHKRKLHQLPTFLPFVVLSAFHPLDVHPAKKSHMTPFHLTPLLFS
jgi:hypothetical protein